MARGIQLSTSIASSSNPMSFSVAPKAIEKELEKATESNSKGNALFGFYATESNYAGIKLFTYWLSVMTVLNGFTVNRAPMNRKLIRAFFRSDSVITHHTKNGNLEKVNSDSIRLTIAGWNYFQGRLNGSNATQRVDPKELAEMVNCITKGGEGYRAI
jgi:hypothetical protein